jgi:uncharacterized membrane protein HdeD (DUF308 family)/alpha-beta hydrolase superfamily lysophospholipase
MRGGLTRFVTASLTRRQWPVWVELALGVVCLVGGVVLTLRPFTSLGVLVALMATCAIATGIGDIAAAGRAVSPRLQQVAGLSWIVAAVGVAAWPALTITGIALWIGVALVVTGALRIGGGVTGRDITVDQRLTDVFAGAAGLILGFLALTWPDVTVLVVAVVFGVRTVIFGLDLLTSARRRHRHGAALPSSASSRSGRRQRSHSVRRFSRSAGALAALIAALLLGSVSVVLHKSSPRLDGFYDASGSVPSAPGVLLRSEPFTRAVPGTATAWRILYTTTDSNGRPGTASGLVLVSKSAPAGPRPVIAWAHGTTGFARRCAPTALRDPFTSGALPALDQVIRNGWVLVATDYLGLGTPGPHPYLVGSGEARSVLDAVRAARHLTGLQLSGKTVVWGHSQGGGAALWTGQIAPVYAPDIPLAGVAALAPASDLNGLIANLDSVRGGAVFAAYVVAAYTSIYPDVRFNDYIRPTAHAQVRAYARRCLAEPEVFVSIASALLADKPIASRSPDQGPFGRRLRENTPTQKIEAPVFLGQGAADGLVLASVQDKYVQLRCGLGGGPLQYRTYPGRGHVDLVADDSPLISDLLGWTTDRFNGRPAPSTC